MKRLTAASAFAALLAVTTLTSSASAEVAGGQTIEAFLGTNLVGLYNYTPGDQVRLEVIRNGVVIGAATKTADEEGFIEINHGGAAAGDCFDDPVTPDIIAGDTLKTTVLDGQGNPTGDVDSDVVRDVAVSFDTITTDAAAGTITVSGRVGLDNPDAPIAPGTDVLELRLNKGSEDVWDTGPGLDQDRAGRKDLRVDIGENVQPGGGWTRTLNVGTQDARDWQDNPGEVFLEWSEAAVGEEEALPPSIFVADQAEGEAVVGCPPLAQYAVTSSNSGAINAVNSGNDLVLSGVSFDASAVSVSLDDQDPATPALTADATLSAPSGSQTWTATIEGGAASLSDGTLTATGAYTVEGGDIGGVKLELLKDTVAPASPAASLEPRSYNSARQVSLSSNEEGAKIFFTTDGSAPSPNSTLFGRPIRVDSTKTIKAITLDRAGNQSEVASFEYVIREDSSVTLGMSKKNLKLRRTQDLSGVVRPAHEGSVRIIIKRGGKRVFSRNLGLTDSRYDFSYKPRSTGRYTVIVRFARDDDHRGSRVVKRFSVRRR